MLKKTVAEDTPVSAHLWAGRGERKVKSKKTVVGRERGRKACEVSSMKRKLAQGFDIGELGWKNSTRRGKGK